jgi:hypothetical protein
MNYFHKSFFLLAALVLLLASCGKNLDQIPQSTASKEAVFGSEDGMKLYTSSFYNMLPDINTPFRTDCNMSDFGATTSAPDFLRTGAYSSRQGSGWSWGDLRNVNYFIVNCTNPAVPQAIRENYIGIAKFFRAYFYFEKVKRFGDVPWYNKPLDVADSALYKGQHGIPQPVHQLLSCYKRDHAGQYQQHITRKEQRCELVFHKRHLWFKVQFHTHIHQHLPEY